MVCLFHQLELYYIERYQMDLFMGIVYGVLIISSIVLNIWYEGRRRRSLRPTGKCWENARGVAAKRSSGLHVLRYHVTSIPFKRLFKCSMQTVRSSIEVLSGTYTRFLEYMLVLTIMILSCYIECIVIVKVFQSRRIIKSQTTAQTSTPNSSTCFIWGSLQFHQL